MNCNYRFFNVLSSTLRLSAKSCACHCGRANYNRDTWALQTFRTQRRFPRKSVKNSENSSPYLK